MVIEGPMGEDVQLGCDAAIAFGFVITFMIDIVRMKYTYCDTESNTLPIRHVPSYVR